MTHFLETKPTEAKYKAPALEKGLDILEVLAGSETGLSQTEIANALGRTPNEIYRMLTTLVRREYILRSEGGDRYKFSLKMFALAHQHPPVNRLLETARGMLCKAALETQQSCHIALEADGNILVVAAAEAPGPWRVSLKPGATVSLWNTGIGRAIAAFQKREARELLYKKHKPVKSENNMDYSTYERVLAEVRALGHARMKSASLLGLTNLGFPILGPYGNAVGALGCLYMERVDKFAVPSLETVEQFYLDLAIKISGLYGVPTLAHPTPA